MRYRGRWQYQGLAEPALPQPRASNLSHQWRPSLPDMPPRQRGLPTALLVAASAFVFSPLAGAPPRPLGWTDAPRRSVARCVSYDTGAERVLTVIPRTISSGEAAAANQKLFEPTRRARRVPPGTGAEFVRAPVVVAEPLGWLDAPLPLPPVPVPTGAEFVPGPMAPVPQQVAWYQRLGEPLRRVPRPVPGTGAEYVRAPAVVAPTQMAWFRPLAEPVRRAPAPTPGTGAEFVRAPAAPVNVQLDWHQPLSEPQSAPRCVEFASGGENPGYAAGGEAEPDLSPPYTALWTHPERTAHWRYGVSTTAVLTLREGETEPLEIVVGATGVSDLDDLSTTRAYFRKAGAATNHIDGALLTVTDSEELTLSLDPVGAKNGGGNAFDAVGKYRGHLKLTWSDGDVTRHPQDEDLQVIVIPKLDA